MEENITNQEEQVINNIEEPKQEVEKCQCNDGKRCRCLPIVNCILLVGLILLYIFHFTGIGAKGGKSLANADAKAPVVVGEGGLKIAYVNTDSLNANYMYIKDLEKQLNAFKQAKENSLKQQMEKLQADDKALKEDYQNYLQTGSSLTLTQQQNKEAELKKRNDEINKRADQLARLEQEYTSQVLEKQNTENKKMVDAIYAFIKEYNAQNQQFNLIFAKTGSDMPFILYGDEAMDITDEIVKGLNEEYEKVKKAKD